MAKIVVFTGAGMSAESGIQTFRGNDGLWENYRIEEVATPEAWERDPSLVLEFYNIRRKQVMEAQPNEAHLALVKLEERFDVQIVTQNIDDLHERAGSRSILHLHGEITKCRSTGPGEEVLDVKGHELNLGEKCESGFQLRPHIVWFGEMVPNMEMAYELVRDTDYFIVIGTSMNVYPAAGLIHYVPANSKIIVVDPNTVTTGSYKGVEHIKQNACEAVPKLVDRLLVKD